MVPNKIDVDVVGPNQYHPISIITDGKKFKFPEENDSRMNWREISWLKL